jgi:hypothetical protein
MKYLLLFFVVTVSSIAFPTLSIPAAGQEQSDSLLALLNEGVPPARQYVTATFKGTRVINGQSVQNVGKGVLDFRVSHRFGALNQGIHNFFGLDNAVTKIAFDYGITDWLTIGLGRGTYEKEYDGFVKTKILKQTVNNRMPLNLSYVGGMYIQSMSMPEIAGATYPFSNRLCYMNQLLIARKFSRHFSLQLMPTHIHYNIVPTTAEPNDIFALGVGGRLKVSNRIAVTGEYYYVLPGSSLNGYHNALSVGIDIETGGHVFQLMFTNASAINERVFIGQTTGQWSKGNIHFGFNISRVFTIVRPKGV